MDKARPLAGEPGRASVRSPRVTDAGMADADPAATRDRLTQRAEYTQRHNRVHGRHGWVRLTPAYSVRLVRERLAAADAAHVLDPFAGTGTTPLCCAERGVAATGADLNPFLAWLARAKTRAYGDGAIAALESFAGTLTPDRLTAHAPAEPPPMRKLDRWWAPDALTFLRHLHTAVTGHAANHEGGELAWVAFCRTLIAVSNARFNHPSMSLAAAGADAPADPARHLPTFRAAVAEVARTAAETAPHAAPTIVRADTRTLPPLTNARADLLITSPPYPNRMSYIRELRPYMFWLGYLGSGREAAELDWASVGGTWGAATSRLRHWRAPALPPTAEAAAERVAASGHANARVLAAYIRKYAADMAAHLHTVAPCLVPGARVHYIVGNAVFYGVVVPAETVLAELLAEAGFREIAVEPLRKRNSKTQLVEYAVTATRHPV